MYVKLPQDLLHLQLFLVEELSKFCILGIFLTTFSVYLTICMGFRSLGMYIYSKKLDILDILAKFGGF